MSRRCMEWSGVGYRASQSELSEVGCAQAEYRQLPGGRFFDGGDDEDRGFNMHELGWSIATLAVGLFDSLPPW